jgi:hypothetical protein
MDSEMALEAIRLEGLQQLVAPSDMKMEAIPSFIALSRISVDAGFAARFSAALDAMTESGELARIFRRHGRCATVGPAHACD